MAIIFGTQDKMTKENITFGQAFAEFMIDKKAENCSETTLSTYNMHIKYFFDSVEKCRDLECRLFSKADWVYFKTHIQQDERKNERTRQTYCRSVRAFLYWCMNNEYIENYFKLTLPKAQKVVKETYTAEELKVLLAEPHRNCTYNTYQTWVFVNFAISTGLRMSSMLAIQTRDYTPTTGTVFIQQTKNNLPQTIRLNPDMCAILNTYIEKFELSGLDYLFCKSGGAQMNRNSMAKHVNKYNKKLGINKTSTHLFRHTYARSFLENDGNVVDLQRKLGHRNISVTMQYLDDYGIDAKKTNEVFNPQARYGTRKAKTVSRQKKMR